MPSSFVCERSCVDAASFGPLLYMMFLWQTCLVALISDLKVAHTRINSFFYVGEDNV